MFKVGYKTCEKGTFFKRKGVIPFLCRLQFIINNWKQAFGIKYKLKAKEEVFELIYKGYMYVPNEK